MIIRAPKPKSVQSIEVGDVLYNYRSCYLVTKTINNDKRYGLVNLRNPNEYHEFKDLLAIYSIMRDGDYELYKGHQVAIEVGINE